MASNVVIVVEPRPAIDKGLVTSALEKLGSDRVMRGHVALGHGTGGDWHNCFLAMCYGPYGALHRIINSVESDPIFDIADMLGLTVHEVHAVTDAYDHCLAEFQALVEEWLELNYHLSKDNPAVIMRDMMIAAIGRRNVEVAGYNRVAAYLEEPAAEIPPERL